MKKKINYVKNRKTHMDNSIRRSRKRPLLYKNTKQRAMQLCLEGALDIGLTGLFSRDPLLLRCALFFLSLTQ